MATERIGAARGYVSRLDADQLAWLYRKPFHAAGSPDLFSELYSVLNALQVLGLERHNRVLEVGSGPGWITELLVMLDVDVTCIEPAEDMIAIARERLDATYAHHHVANRPNVDFLQTTLEVAELPSQAFDAVLFHESLHHVVDEHACLHAVYNALRPGGRMIVCEWSWRPGEIMLESSLQGEMERFGTLESPFTQEYLEQLLRKAGFSEITRYHSINGFIPQPAGANTVERMAQVPATRTNNLSALRPYECATSRERGTIDRDSVIVEIRALEWLEAARIVRVSISIANHGQAVLLKDGRGRITVSMCRGFPGRPGFSDAGRKDIPRTLRPGETVEFEATFVVPEGRGLDELKLELVAEEVEWLDLASKPRLADFLR